MSKYEHSHDHHYHSHDILPTDKWIPHTHDANTPHSHGGVNDYIVMQFVFSLRRCIDAYT